MKKVLIGTSALVLWFASVLNAGSPAQSSKNTGAQVDPAQAARLNNLGVAYMNQQAFEKAFKYFQDAHAADPQLRSARLNQGIALLNIQKVTEALPILQEAIKRDPKSARAWYNLGLLYKSSGDSAQALEAFRKASALAPNDADAHYFAGLMYSQTGENKSAAAEFQKALQINPFHASAEFGLARAYQKMEDADQAKLHLARFQHLTQTKIGSPITLAYGEQGPLSLVEAVGSKVQQADAAIPVKFVDLTKEWGIKATPAGDSKSLTGAGSCVLDYDGDGSPDIFFTGAGLFHNAGGGKFVEVTKGAGLPATAALACAAADYDNDGRTDLAIAYNDQVALYHNDGGKLREVTETVGLKVKATSRSLLFIDFDHDGDADLYVVTDDGAQMWRNNGNSTFTDVTAETALTFEGPGNAAIASDVNNDRAVDIVATPKSGSPVLFSNPREGKWTSTSPFPDAVKNATSIASLDFNKDGWMDLAITTAQPPGIVLLRNSSGNKFEQVELPATGLARGTSVLSLDYDNDGFIDLMAAGVTDAGAAVIKLFRNLGSDKFEDVTARTGLDKMVLKSEPFLSSSDLDGDGDIDLIVTQPGSAPIVLRNDGGSQYKSLRLSFKGLADNKSGLGTKVEVFAGDLWQKWEIHGGGGPGQSSTDLIVGLGKRTQVDVVRMLWPTGVIQDEIEVPITKPQQMIEIDRRGSSCPVLFAWNGRRYEFISDMIGSGVVGHWVGPNERNVPDPTEYLKVSGDIVKALNGRLSFRFMEPMEEVVYLDQVRLLAVDHPSDYDVYPNEYFASNPPFPEFKVIAARSSDVRLPAGAWDEKGRDVLAHLAKSDHDYVSGFKLLNFAGYTEPHALELDLGKPYSGGPLRLLMHGFIEYFTATSMYAAHQAGLDPVAPYVEAQDASGSWIRVVDDMGFPAGLPRATVADLTGKLPTGTQRIRIGTNLQIYWDQILVDRTAETAPARVQDVPLATAQLTFHGYPRDIERQTNARGDHYYIYEQVSKTGPYARQAGAYTRLGDAKHLVGNADDKFAVFGSGDAMELEFDPSHLPTLRPGWVRDYFFFAEGYEKDMDFYAADGLTVDPLPYSAMPGYPYGANDSFLRGKSDVEYLLDNNTRFFTGTPAGVRSSYRFKE